MPTSYLNHARSRIEWEEELQNFVKKQKIRVSQNCFVGSEIGNQQIQFYRLETWRSSRTKVRPGGRDIKLPAKASCTWSFWHLKNQLHRLFDVPRRAFVVFVWTEHSSLRLKCRIGCFLVFQGLILMSMLRMNHKTTSVNGCVDIRAWRPSGKVPPFPAAFASWPQFNLI